MTLITKIWKKMREWFSSKDHATSFFSRSELEYLSGSTSIYDLEAREREIMRRKMSPMWRPR